VEVITYKVKETVNIYEAKTHFSELVNAATEGREIFIARAGKPIAKLVPLNANKRKVRFGRLPLKKVWESLIMKMILKI